MGYQCLDCTHSGRQFPNGACPGCGSRNIRKLRQGAEEELKKPGKLSLVLCVGLWIYLLIEITRRVVT